MTTAGTSTQHRRVTELGEQIRLAADRAAPLVDAVRDSHWGCGGNAGIGDY